MIRSLKKLFYERNPYFRKFFGEVNLKKPEKLVFCSFDLETTGLDVDKDEIVSIGAVKIIDLKVDFSTSFFTYVRPKISLSRENVLVHGIREDDLKEAPPVEEVLPKFLTYIKGTVLVGYFVKFDILMLSKYTKNLYGFEILNPYIDVRYLAQLHLKRRYLHGLETGERSLDEIMKEVGLEVDKRHNALCDSLVVAFLFLYFVKNRVDWKKALCF